MSTVALQDHTYTLLSPMGMPAGCVGSFHSLILATQYDAYCPQLSALLANKAGGDCECSITCTGTDEFQVQARVPN